MKYMASGSATDLYNAWYLAVSLQGKKHAYVAELFKPFISPGKRLHSYRPALKINLH